MEFDPHDYDDAREDERWGYDRNRNDCDRDRDDPRNLFVDGLDLPRGWERELVDDDCENLDELNGEDSRMIATIGAFRAVSERTSRTFASRLLRGQRPEFGRCQYPACDEAHRG